MPVLFLLAGLSVAQGAPIEPPGSQPATRTFEEADAQLKRLEDLLQRMCQDDPQVCPDAGPTQQPEE